MPVYYDQLQRAVNVPLLPRHIISLVPSQTELLYDLGLAGRMVGCTKFCIHPAGLKQQLAVVGGTKQVDMEAVHQLRPDLIVANKEENRREDIEALMLHYPVWISDITKYRQALEMIGGIGVITGTEQQSIELTAQIESRFSAMKIIDKPLKAVYLIWRKPYMAAGAGTFINDMLYQCGFDNLITASRYPVISVEGLQQAAPECVLLSSEPYPFKEKHIAELHAVLPDAKIILVDGEMFSWYGSRMQYAPAYFQQLQRQVDGSNQTL